MWDGTVTTYEQASPCLRDALGLIGRLRTDSAIKALDRLKNSEPDPPPFSFQIHEYSGLQTDSFCDRELSEQPFQQGTNPNQFLYPGSPIAEAGGSGSY